MDDSQITIKVGFGTYNILDKMYNKFVKNSLSDTDGDTLERWYTYETIMKELIDLGKINLFEEVKYRLTDGEDPNDTIIDIINRDNETRTFLWSYSRKLKEFKNYDLLKRFYD